MRRESDFIAGVQPFADEKESGSQDIPRFPPFSVFDHSSFVVHGLHRSVGIHLFPR